MTVPRFLQIHTLTSYPAVLLNRDDAGLAKRMTYGGVSRTRVSSQCLKRHWRTVDHPHALDRIGVAMAVRSRETFRHEILTPLLAEGIAPEHAEAAVIGLLESVLRESDRSRRARGGAKPDLDTDQLVVLGRPELRFLLDAVRAIVRTHSEPVAIAEAVRTFVKAQSENLKAMVNAAGLDAALFGRMITSDILARTDAAVHVAHAFTVHEEESESDYFAAVDDLAGGGDDARTAHLGTAELTSGTFYGYVVVDLPLLTSNLTGCDRMRWTDVDRGLTARVVESLLHLIATVSPGAKRGSTAPYGFAELVLVEHGDHQPRTLAGAFQRPVCAAPDRSSSTGAALAMQQHLERLDAMYGCRERRWMAALEPELAMPGVERSSFDAVVASATAAIVA